MKIFFPRGDTMVKVMEKKGMSSWCVEWSVKDWFWAFVSEGALYLFLWYWVDLLVVSPSLYKWGVALVSLVLLNVAFFACPMVRKHYM